MSCPVESGYPPEEWQAPQPQSTLDLLSMHGPDGPFFMRSDATPIDSARLRILGKLDSSSEETIYTLMEELDILPYDEGDTGVIVSAICLAANYYRSNYPVNPGFEQPSHKSKIRQLRDATKQFNQLPLLSCAKTMFDFYAGERNEEVEAVVRILFSYEGDLIQNTERQTPNILP